MAKYLIGNIKGPAGEDGFSPTATVTQTSTGATITVTDANGTTTANIRNGIDGDGSPIDLSDYATKIDLATLQYSVEHAGYATETYVDGEIEDIEFPVTSVNGMVGNVTIPIPDVSNYATKAYVDAAIEEVDGFSGDYDDLTNKPDLSVYAETADLATVATTGDYDDLTNKPTIPVLPTLATVATSGSYTDLSNKPAIPIYTAGNNITISNGEISATDTTYTAGTGIDITNGVISATGGGGSGADLDDVAEYLEETYGLSYESETIPTTDYPLEITQFGHNIHIGTNIPAPHVVTNQLDMGLTTLYDGNDTVLATIAAQTWNGSQGGGTDGDSWGMGFSPSNNQYGIRIGIDASAQGNWVFNIHSVTVDNLSDVAKITTSISIGGTVETIGTLNAKFIPNSIATKQDLNNPNMIRGGVEGAVQQAYGMGIQHQGQEVHIDASAEQMDSSNKAQFYMELQDPSRLLRDMRAEISCNGNTVGGSMGFQEDNGKYVSTYTYKGGNTYGMEYDPSTEYWTVDYDYDEFTADGDDYINIAAAYYEDIVTYQSLSPEFIPIDNDTITINNGVLVASSGGSGGGTSYIAGDGIEIDGNDNINVLVDTNTIDLDSNNCLTIAQGVIPTDVSELNNDAGYITSADLPGDELPTIASGDAGKVLAVNSGETGVEWTTASGGSTYTAGDGIDITNDVISNNRYSVFPVSRESNGWYSFATTKDAFIAKLNNGDLVKTMSQLDLVSITPAEITSGRTTIIYVGGSYSSNKVSVQEVNTIQLIETKFYYLAKGRVMDTLYRFDGPESIWKTLPIELKYEGGTYKSTLVSLLNSKQNSLPAITNNQSKVLAVNSDASGLEWVEQSSGGGGSSDANVLTPVIRVSNLDASGLAPVGAQWLVAKQAGNNSALLPKAFEYGGALYWETQASNIWGDYNNPVISYTHFVPWYVSTTTKRLYVEQINITINRSTGAITAVNSFPLSNWYEPVPTTSANAASAIYLKDTNNVVYEITVDTNGQLVATAQQ